MRRGAIGNGIVGAAAGAIIAATGLSGCGTSTRMMVEPSTGTLADKGRGVVVVKFSMPYEACRQQVLLLGTREGNGHRVVAKLMATGAAPATTANAAETELAAGEYQLLGYVCQRARSFVNVGNEGGPYTSSLGRFTVKGGEVVNIGHLVFTRAQKDVKVEVSDWALADLNRYRDERPKLFAGMTTRLVELKAGVPMPAAEKSEKCDQLAELKAAGKVQGLPKGCT